MKMIDIEEKRMNKYSALFLSGLGILTALLFVSSIATAQEISVKPSFYGEDGSYYEYTIENGLTIYPPGEYKPTPIAGPKPSPTIQCIKESYPIKIVPILNEDGEVIDKKIEAETDPGVWEKIGYSPNKCETNFIPYAEEELMLIDEKVYKTMDILPTYRNTSIQATPAPKVKASSIKSKKIKNVWMAPARDTFKAFGFKVEWNKKKKILKATKGKQTIEVYQNSSLAKINGAKIKKMSSFSKIQNNTLMVPLDFITSEFKDSIMK